MFMSNINLSILLQLLNFSNGVKCMSGDSCNSSHRKFTPVRKVSNVPVQI